MYGSPVIVNFAQDLISIELLPALTSTGPGSMTNSPENLVYPSRVTGILNLIFFEPFGSRVT
ncbi:MAG TPA: hypothetical protein VFT71_03500 [Candidatus Nitrosocosmicus sp.]|nr:hypothetical protein [Candidatus Nitrosocosmicus sp.]